jgi:endonuclease/exonuclease/phosphatase family metal-dependent hydrolase
VGSASESGVFVSPEACERAPAYRPVGTELRVGSLNVRWFPDGHSRPREGDAGTDLRWLSCILAKSGFDVLAVQEFKQGPAGREALAQLLDQLEARTGARYSAHLDECPENGRQHVGFLWNTRRVTLEAFRQVDDVNPLGGCRGRLRPGLEARARFVSGSELMLLTLHLDSGRTGRDFGHRQESFARVAAWLAGARRRGTPGLALGDFNTMGCGRCEIPQDGVSELAGLDSTLPGRLPLPEGAACSEYYRGRAGLLDHAVFVPGRRGLRAQASVLGPCASRHCARAPRGDAYLTRVSDHCPLLVRLTPADRLLPGLDELIE